MSKLTQISNIIAEMIMEDPDTNKLTMQVRVFEKNYNINIHIQEGKRS